MPRLTNLIDVLFSVAERPVFASVPNGAGERHVSVPGKKAIVNMTTNSVLGIVSRSYRLVQNQEALGSAFDCCRAVFPETPALRVGCLCNGRAIYRGALHD